MSVMRAVNDHAVHTFSTYVREKIKSKGLSIAQFCELVSGTKNSSGGFYLLMNGKRALTDYTAEKWAANLGVSVEDLLKANSPIRAIIPTRKRRGSTGIERVQPVVRSPPVIQRSVETTPFSFVVNPDGVTATVSLQLDSIPLARALRVLQAIGLADLLKPEEKPRRLTHHQSSKDNEG